MKYSDVDNFFRVLFENTPDILKTPDRLKTIVETLEQKGYYVKYSSPGYNDTTFKSDRNDDQIVNGQFISTARIIFAGDYDFKSTPEGWVWKRLNEGNIGLYSKPKYFNKNTNPHDDPKTKYKQYIDECLKELQYWVDELPANDTNDD